jgi:hypothetical protein
MGVRVALGWRWWRGVAVQAAALVAAAVLAAVPRWDVGQAQAAIQHRCGAGCPCRKVNSLLQQTFKGKK